MPQIVQLVMMMVSTSGYLLLGAKRFHWHIALMPAIFCAFVSTALILAGYIGCMAPLASLLYAGGFVAGGYLIARKDKPSITEAAFLAVFWALCAYAAWLSLRSSVVAYDNYTHWATVVQCMLQTNRMPTAADTMVAYQTYPLGSSMVLYYFCRMIQPNDTWMQFGQLFLRFSFLLSLCALLNRKNWIMVLGIVSYAILGVQKNMTPTDLLVDVILGMAAVSAVAVMVSCREQPRKALVPFCLMTCLVCNIKQSGILFALFSILLALWLVRREQRKLSLRHIGAMVGIPMLDVLLWRVHVAMTFPKAQTQYHAVSLTKYAQIYAEKSAEDVQRTVERFWDSLWQPDGDTVCVLLTVLGVMAVLVLVLFLARKPAQAWSAMVFSLVLVGILALYDIGVVGMYVFSMSKSEGLNGFERYTLTGLVFLFGLACIYLMQRLPGAFGKQHWLLTAVASCGLAVLFMLPICHRSALLPELYVSQEDNTYWNIKPSWDRDFYNLRKKLDAFSEEFPALVASDAKILAYGQNALIWDYVFWNQEVHVDTNPDWLAEHKDQYDVFLCDGNTEPIADFLKQLGEPIDNHSGLQCYLLK